MKFNITIPDDQVPELRRMALEATQIEGRAITPTTLCGQMVTAAILADLDEKARAAEPGDEVAWSDKKEVDYSKPRPPAALPIPTRPAFGPTGGASLEEQGDVAGDLERAQAALLRKRAALGLDSTGLAPEQASTRAAVEGTGPRPMGFLAPLVKAGKVDAGKVPPSGPHDPT